MAERDGPEGRQWTPRELVQLIFLAAADKAHPSPHSLWLLTELRLRMVSLECQALPVAGKRDRPLAPR